MVNATTRPLYSGKATRYPLWVPGPVWTAAESLAPTGVRSSDRPARSESVYRLSHLSINDTSCAITFLSKPMRCFCPTLPVHRRDSLCFRLLKLAVALKATK